MLVVLANEKQRRVGLIGFYNPQILDGQDVGLCG